MKRTTIQAESDFLEKARTAAAREGISFSELARQGLEIRMRQSRPRPRIAAIGSSSDGRPVAEVASGRVPVRE